MAKIITPSATATVRTIALKEYPHAPYLSMGLNAADSPYELNQMETPACSNIEFRKAELWKRPGFSQMGTAVAGIPMALVDFEDASGSRVLVCITTTKVYEWNSTSEDWDDITGEGISLTATADDYVSWTITQDSSGNVILVFTNGIDPIYKFDNGATSTDIQELGGAGTYKAKFVMSAYNHLFLLNTTEGGVVNPQRVRWSNGGDPETYIGGTSGFVVLIDDASPIYGAAQQGGRIYVYRQRSIDVLDHQDTSPYFVPSNLIPATGVISPGGFAVLDEYHVVTTLRATSLFNGAPNLDDTNISRRVEPIMHDAVSQEYAHRGHTLAMRDQPKFLWVFPTGDEYATSAFIYEMSMDRWSAWNFRQFQVSAIGTYRRYESLTWADTEALGWTWETVSPSDRPWVQAELSAKAPILIIGTADGKVWQRDVNSLNDGALSVNSFVDTKDFWFPDEQVRSFRLCFNSIGNSVKTSWSADGGETWTEIGEQTLSGSWTHYEQTFDTGVQRRLRFRFENDKADETFGLRDFYVELVRRTNR